MFGNAEKMIANRRRKGRRILTIMLVNTILVWFGASSIVSSTTPIVALFISNSLLDGATINTLDMVAARALVAIEVGIDLLVALTTFPICCHRRIRCMGSFRTLQIAYRKRVHGLRTICVKIVVVVMLLVGILAIATSCCLEPRLAMA